MQLVFKIPSGSAPVKTRIVVRAVDMKGTMWLDGFQLEEGLLVIQAADDGASVLFGVILTNLLVIILKWENEV